MSGKKSKEHPCSKCGKIFDDITHLRRHIEKKIPCDKPKDSLFLCKFCMRCFTTKGNCKYHEENRCVKNYEMQIQKHEQNGQLELAQFVRQLQEKEKLESETKASTVLKQEEPTPSITSSSSISGSSASTNILHESSGSSSVASSSGSGSSSVASSSGSSINVYNYGNIEQQNIIENQTNISIQPQINHIYVLPYGYENMEHITDAYLLELYNESRMWNAIPKLVKDIHLNEKHPENMNLVLKNTFKGTFECKRDKNEWIEFNSKDTTDDLIADKGQMIHNFFEQHKEHLNAKQTKNHTDLQSNLKLNKDYHAFLKKKIIEMFKNAKLMIDKISQIDKSNIEMREVEEQCHTILKTIEMIKGKGKGKEIVKS
jgi:hypothetical protein